MTHLKNYSTILFFVLGLFTLAFLSSCSDDDTSAEELKSTSFEYAIHNGQAVPTAAYAGSHPTDFSATMKLDEMENGNTMITMTLNNTISGVLYHMHAHDGADASTTPNGTPYSETPNGDVFANMVTGNGNTVTSSQEAMMSYDEIINDYSGFFVIHDPLQDVSTTDITSYLVVGGFARTQDNPDYSSTTFSYDFNAGQLVANFAYEGTHATDLAATIQVDELAENKSRITVRLMNTMDGETYNAHAHDMADAATTPNGTPYIETPNSDVFAGPIEGNGNMAGRTNISSMSYEMITTSYDGFFVVHDPLQDISTTDPTTYVLLGVFAR